MILSGKGANNEKKSSHKYAKLGNITTRTIVVLAALMMCLIYVTFIGISASQSSNANSASPATATTCHAFCTVTSTTTSTSYVCCQTVTSTVTTTPTTTTYTVTQPISTVTSSVTATVTQTPNVKYYSVEDKVTCTSTSGCQGNNFVGPAGVDCVVTVTIYAYGFANGQVALAVENSAQVGVMTVLLPGPDNAPYTQTVSGNIVFITVVSTIGGSVTDSICNDRSLSNVGDFCCLPLSSFFLF